MLFSAITLLPFSTVVYHTGQQVAFASQDTREAEHLPVCITGNVWNYTPLIRTALQTDEPYVHDSNGCDAICESPAAFQLLWHLHGQTLLPSLQQQYFMQYTDSLNTLQSAQTYARPSQLL